MDTLARNLNWTVVLLEDEPDQRESIAERLRELTRWVVVEVDNGDECLTTIKRRHPHVVILDIEIATSDTQGSDVARQVFKERKGATIPLIVMLTRIPVIDIYIAGKPLGDAYIEKRYFLQDPGALVCFIERLYEARTKGEPVEWPLIYKPERDGI